MEDPQETDFKRRWWKWMWKNRSCISQKPKTLHSRYILYIPIMQMTTWNATAQSFRSILCIFQFVLLLYFGTINDYIVFCVCSAFAPIQGLNGSRNAIQPQGRKKKKRTTVATNNTHEISLIIFGASQLNIPWKASWWKWSESQTSKLKRESNFLSDPRLFLG